MKNIFIACDTTNTKKINKIIKLSHIKSSKYKIGYKFGLEFFYTKNGRNFLSKLKTKNLWLDLKIFDIPNTSAASIASLRDLKNISYITIHISGGIEMMRLVKKQAKKYNKNLKVLGVTILTSFSNSSIKKIGHTRSIKDLVRQQTKLAKEAKLDGVVCSAYEINIVKRVSKKIKIFTPGIRLAGEKKNDQERVMTPANAFKNGANSIVIGRSITAGNIKKNFQKLIKSLD